MGEKRKPNKNKILGAKVKSLPNERGFQTPHGDPATEHQEHSRGFDDCISRKWNNTSCLCQKPEQGASPWQQFRPINKEGVGDTTN